MSDEDTAGAPEFSLIVVAADLPREGRHFKMKPDQEALTALANRFGLQELSQLAAHMHAKPLADGSIVRIQGEVQAELVQSCVVTLEPVPESIDEEFAAEYSTEEISEEEVEHNLEEADPREPMDNGTIDLGELLAQQLGLMMSPYPRSTDSSLSDLQSEAGEKGRDFEVDAGRHNPFSVLAGLKEDKKK